MRILAISDSHGNTYALTSAISAHPKARHVFFLGDNTRDIEAVCEHFPDKYFHIVRGNCDFGAPYNDELLEDIEGVRIFCCHGHTAFVKSSKEVILQKTKAAGAVIGLCGHTHCSDITYKDGIYLINPGSVARPRDSCASYACIDILESGILPAIITMK